MAQRKLDVVLDSVKRLQRMGATSNLVNLLQKQYPADLAQLFADLPDKDRLSAFSLLVERNSRLAMEALSELGPEAGAALLAGRSAEEIVKLTQELPSDDVAAIIDHLPEELSAAVLELMQKRPASADVGELLEYPEKTAGRIMNPKVFALSEDMTAAEAIAALQGSRDVEMVFYLYVIDGRRHLVGVVSLRRLLLVPPDTPLKRIMTTDLISVRVDMDQEEVARQVASYNLLAIPVVDEENKLGRRDHRRRRHRRHQGRSDRGRLPACRRRERRPRVHARRSESLRKRLPWLLVNLATAFIAASVVKLFEGTISVVTSLAVFMPVVAGMGGNAATQTLAVIVRGIALGELTWSNSRKALIKEALVGVGNGIACGLVGGGVVWLMQGTPWMGVDPGHGDDHQHVRRRDCRHGDSAVAAGAESRSGAGVVGVHHDADRRVRLFFVPGAWRVVHQVLAGSGIE